MIYSNVMERRLQNHHLISVIEGELLVITRNGDAKILGVGAVVFVATRICFNIMYTKKS